MEWVAISSSRNLPSPGIELESPAWQVNSLPLSHRGSPMNSMVLKVDTQLCFLSSCLEGGLGGYHHCHLGWTMARISAPQRETAIRDGCRRSCLPDEMRPRPQDFFSSVSFKGASPNGEHQPSINDQRVTHLPIKATAPRRHHVKESERDRARRPLNKARESS